MTFNIHQPVFEKESGEYLEKDEGIQPGWSDTMMDLGINYLRDDGYATRLRYGF